MFKKKNLFKLETDNLLDIKKTADARWNYYFGELLAGNQFDHKILGQCMIQCNQIDSFLLRKGLLSK